VLGLGDSGSGTALGAVARRVGIKASLSLPIGEGERLIEEPTSSVWACLRAESEADGAESPAGVVVESESTVSEAMRGEERVR